MTQVIVGRIQFLTGCWTECLSSLLSVGQVTLSSFHMGLSNKADDLASLNSPPLYPVKCG